MTVGTRSARSGRCNVAADPLDPALPVAGTGSLAQVRRSKRSKWRAGVLIGIHLLIAAHVTHFLIARRTLSPVEPSESMYTLELGYLNAGFLFFAVALLGTLVFGRFFCGWACHIVALQDLCAWLMKKLGVRPRLFRSRLLALTPLVVALYMFVWPTFLRLVLGSPSGSFPGLSNHLVTRSFWQTFPGPTFALLTSLTCGFAAVYFLGAKGFCTYGCPYGAAFGAMDTLSPGRIVVNDSCEQCGHCTVTCTSNVRVHEEVKLFGMVVDKGCMKCMDCVSVCPKGALSFAFARPSLLKRSPAAPRVRRFDLTLQEELIAAAVCLAATLAFRGLYDGPPLLMSVALGGLSAFFALTLWRLGRVASVRIQNLTLKLSGKVQRAGWVFAAGATLWLGFAAHSGFVQWHRAWGSWYLERTEATRADVLSGAFREKTYSARHERAASEARRHLLLADAWGLVGVVEIKVGLAWCALLRLDPGAAEARVREAIALEPRRSDLWQNLFEVARSSGRLPAAIEALRRKMELDQGAAPAAERFQLAGLLAEDGRSEEAVREYELCAQLAPASAEVRYNLGGLYRRLGRNQEALEHLRTANRLGPDDADTLVELGLAAMAAGHALEALGAFERARAIAPDSPESRLHLPALIQQLERSRAAAAGERAAKPASGH